MKADKAVMSKSKPEFTLLKDPGVDDLIKLFEQLTGNKEEVSEEERKEMARIGQVPAEMDGSFYVINGVGRRGIWVVRPA